MWIKKEKEPIWMFLIWVVIIWVLSVTALKLLTPYSITYGETGKMTIGYLAYVVIGMLFTTPGPVIALYITLRRKEHITLKEYLKRIIYTKEPTKAVIITGTFCTLALVFAIIEGVPNGEPWYLLPIGFLLMIPFVGVAEETGWRGFLQPAFDKKIIFPFSTLAVAAIWFIWHIDQWFDPTSNHYGDSLFGFAINIIIWAFALAAIYKVTKSVIACAIYHAFIDALGAIYDWNLLFDTFPGDVVTNVYRLVILSASVFLWLYTDRTEKSKGLE